MAAWRAAILAVSVPAAALSCSSGERLRSPDGGASWTLPDARVPATPGAGFTIEQASSSYQGPTIRLACSSGGDALAIYADAVGSWTRRFRGGAWGDPIPLPVDAGAVSTVVMSPGGAAAFGWPAPLIKEITDTADVMVATLSAGDTWSATINVGDSGLGWSQGGTMPIPALALDEDDTVFAAWSRIDEPTDGWPCTVWANQVDPGRAAAAGEPIEQKAGNQPTPPSLLARGPGEPVAAWIWSDGVRERLLVSRRAGSVWLPPKILEDADRTQVVMYGPWLVGGRSGPMMLVYQRSSAALGAQVLARRSVDGDNWTDAGLVVPAGAGWFELAGNGGAGAIIAWSDLLDDSTPAKIRTFDPASDWSQPFAPVPTGVTQPLVAAHADGRIAVVYADRLAGWPVVLQRFDPGSGLGWRPSELLYPMQGAAAAACYAGDTLLVAWKDEMQGWVAAFPDGGGSASP
jgi:hypothetical protein